MKKLALVILLITVVAVSLVSNRSRPSLRSGPEPSGPSSPDSLRSDPERTPQDDPGSARRDPDNRSHPRLLIRLRLSGEDSELFLDCDGSLRLHLASSGGQGQELVAINGECLLPAGLDPTSVRVVSALLCDRDYFPVSAAPIQEEDGSWVLLFSEAPPFTVRVVERDLGNRLDDVRGVLAEYPRIARTAFPDAAIVEGEEARGTAGELEFSQAKPGSSGWVTAPGFAWTTFYLSGENSVAQVVSLERAGSLQISLDRGVPALNYETEILQLMDTESVVLLERELPHDAQGSLITHIPFGSYTVGWGGLPGDSRAPRLVSKMVVIEVTETVEISLIIPQAEVTESVLSGSIRLAPPSEASGQFESNPKLRVTSLAPRVRLGEQSGVFVNQIVACDPASEFGLFRFGPMALPRGQYVIETLDSTQGWSADLEQDLTLDLELAATQQTYVDVVDSRTLEPLGGVRLRWNATPLGTAARSGGPLWGYSGHPEGNTGFVINAMDCWLQVRATRNGYVPRTETINTTGGTHLVIELQQAPTVVLRVEDESGRQVGMGRKWMSQVRVVSSQGEVYEAAFASRSGRKSAGPAPARESAHDRTVQGSSNYSVVFEETRLTLHEPGLYSVICPQHDLYQVSAPVRLNCSVGEETLAVITVRRK